MSPFKKSIKIITMEIEQFTRVGPDLFFYCRMPDIKHASPDIPDNLALPNIRPTVLFTLLLHSIYCKIWCNNEPALALFGPIRPFILFHFPLKKCLFLGGGWWPDVKTDGEIIWLVRGYEKDGEFFFCSFLARNKNENVLFSFFYLKRFEYSKEIKHWLK